MTVKQENTVRTLLEAMPYIRGFWGTTVVIKYGGAAMTSPSLQAQFAEDIVLLRLIGMRPVIIHGGGPEISRHMRLLGLEPQFVAGHRVTDAATMEIAKMVLVGKVNKEIVGLISRHGGTAVGISGEDGHLLQARPKDHLFIDGAEVDLGFVGEVTAVNTEVLHLLAEANIPVVATVGADLEGNAYNINADTAAGEIAAALAAEKIIFLTDVDGIYEDRGDGQKALSSCTLEYLAGLRADGTIGGGMLPKVAAVERALTAGVGSAHIIDGRVEHAMLLEVLTDAGCGTKITL